MRRQLILLLIIGLFVFACSTNRYMVADNFLEKEDYNNALNEYVKLAEANGSFKLSQDLRALSGAMIAYYGMGNYKNAFTISRRILSLDTYNSAAIFYAGLCLEEKKKVSLAKRIYRYYQFLPSNDPYYNLIKSRFNLMVEEEMAARAKMAVQMEKSVGLGQVVDNTLAVLYYVNILEDPRWDAVSKGIAEMMITDFAQVEQLKVIERVHLQKLLEEMELAMSGLADENTVPRMGRLMRAKNLVHGSFMVKAGRNLTVNSDLIDVSDNQGFGAEEFNGEMQEILAIEKEIVFATLKKLNIQVSASVQKKIKANTTKSLNAFLAFCNGLNDYDNGDYEAALTQFQNSVKYDPNFGLAKNMANMTQALNFVASNQFVSRHPAIMNRRYAIGARTRQSAPGMRQRNYTHYRLQQLSQNLDLGYLPGNNSRNGSELVRDDIAEQLPDFINPRELLPLPPSPPLTNPNNP